MLFLLFLLLGISLNSAILTHKNPTGSHIAPDASRTFYEYQGDRLVQVTDQRGGIWQIEYNGENQITKITDPEGNQSSTTYNQYGQKVSESDFLGRIVSYTYDRLGNLFSITDPSGAQTELLYDPNGRLIKKILPDGETEELSWEEGDFLAQKKRIAAMGSGTTPSERIQKFLGDEYGRITQSVTSQNEAWPQTYDAASLLEKTSFPEGGFLLSRYDSLNRPEKLIDRGGAERVFTYTPQGQEKSLKMPPTAQHPEGRETIREYNLAGELIRITYPDLSLEEIERDLMGRPIQITYTPSASGSGSSAPIPNSAPAHSEELILTYNQAGELVEIRSQLPGGQNPKTITQTYDILGRLTSRTLPFLQRRVEYEYNGASELVTKREINTQTQAIRTSLYTYTARGELASLTENGSTTLLEYSPGGKITKITYPAGISLTQSYNGFGELQSQIWKNASDETLHEISYEYNLNGKVTRITTPEGQTQHSYDSESRLVQTIHPDGNTETFIFNSAGYLSEKKDNSRRLLMSYNESGQVVEVLEYIPPTAPAHTSRLLWNWFSDGLLQSIENTTTNTATYYLWNAQKKLEGVAFTDGTSTAYAYLPGSDLRLSSVNRSGAATLFHWDGVQLREVLNPKQGSGANSPPIAIGGRATNLPTDSNSTQTITSAWLTGQPGTWDEVLTASIPAGENPENLLLFLQNHQSSVMGQIETSNPLVSRQLFTYLAYGEPKGTSPESLPLAGIGYTGRQHDDTGLMYYRGRYYNHCTGSFISEDPKRDGWNWYGYSNDPVNNTDPSGYQTDPNTNWLEESIANDSFQRNKCDPLFKNDFGLDPYLEAILNTATEVTATVVVNAALGGMIGVVARGAMAAAPKGGITRSAGAWAKNLYRKADRTLVWQKNPVGVNAGTGAVTKSGFSDTTDELLKIVAQDGTTITGFTKHGINRVIGDNTKRAGTNPTAILDALKNPLKIKQGLDPQQRPFKIYTGKSGRVIINPETGKVVSTNPLSHKRYHKP